uniref:Transposase Tc1-like domain-containing protein n=1 Tax=Sphaeramia orbicularis TaxID=375764 RepID=A0A673AQB7_9TELE
MLQAGWSRWAVARVFGVHHSTVGRLAECYHTTSSSNKRPRSGQLHVTTAAQDRANRPSHLHDRFRPAIRTAAETIGTHHILVSPRTIRNHLQADGIRPYRPYVGSVLTPQHCHARMQWCSAHRCWTLQKWSQVVSLWTNVFLLHFGVFL